MPHPFEPTQAECKLTTDTLSPEEARFRDWLLEGDAAANGNAHRDKAKAVRPSRPQYDCFEPRVSVGQNSIIFNLGNVTGDTIELMPSGWKIASDPARAARRSRTIAGLPLPDKPSPLPVHFHALRNLLNLRDQDDWDRCLCWLLAALRPEGPYPVLLITGPKGSGKTTAALLLRSLIDPAQFPLSPLTTNERYIALLAQIHWVLAFDNVKSAAAHQTTAICAANRPAILVVPDDATWIPGPEIAGRLLTIHTHPLPESKQRKSDALWWDFKNIRCQTLSAILTSVCVALGNHRQAGFGDIASWLRAAEPAIKLSPAEIQAILSSNKPQPCAENLAAAIATLMAGTPSWTGTATKLLKALHAVDPASSDWPKTPQAISERLRQSVPKLRDQQIDMKIQPKGLIDISARLTVQPMPN